MLALLEMSWPALDVRTSLLRSRCMRRFMLRPGDIMLDLDCKLVKDCCVSRKLASGELGLPTPDTKL